MKAALPIIAVLLLAFFAFAQDGDAGAGTPSAARPSDTEIGIASWYGYPYHGRHAADGEIYDMEKLTAAHRTLPFGTWVRVVNLRNERSVEVRITDRGPFIDGRIIDLSKAAARAVDLIAPGIGAVRVEVIDMPKGFVPDLFAVQVGAFRDRRNAHRYLSLMQSQYGPGRIVLREGDPALWRVLVGAEKTQEGAIALAVRIREESAERSAFVARLDH